MKNNQLEKYSPGLFQNAALELRLVLRLMGDSRVPWYAKLVPVGAIVYGIIPEAFPVIDDALVFGVGYYTFTALCPPDVVLEHRNKLLVESGFPVDSTQEQNANPEEITEAEFHEVDGEENAQ